jgi:hypothetical protein
MHTWRLLHPVSLVCHELCCAAVQLTFLFDDIGIPKNYRHMPGFGVHTFRLINAEGKDTYVKFHWTPKQGVCGSWRHGVGLMVHAQVFQALTADQLTSQPQLGCVHAALHHACWLVALCT